jgi:Tol biopolymer transport system component
MKQKIILSMLTLGLIVGCGKQVSKTVPQPTPAGPSHAFINGPLTGGGDVTDRYDVTPDSSKVVYIADEDTDGVEELYVSNVDGTNKLKLSQPIGLADDVIFFRISPDSQKVAYTARIGGLTDLYSVNLDATQRFMVNQGVPDGAHRVSNFFYWLNSSLRLAYTSDEFNVTAGNFGLYESNFDGTSLLTLSTDSTAEAFSLSPNGARIVYRKGTVVNPTLRSVRVDGTGDVLLNTPFDLVAVPSAAISSFSISPNSALVAYRSNQVDSSSVELYLVNIDGTGPRTRISGTLVSGRNVILNFFSPDSSKIVYLADQDTDNVNELYMNTVANAGAIKISGAAVAGGSVGRFQVLDSRVVFMGDLVTDGIQELFVATYGGVVTKINSALATGEKVVDFIADNTHVAYQMDKGDAGRFSVYGNALSGGSEVKLSQPLSGGPGSYDESAASIAPRQTILINGQVYYRSGITSATYTGYRVPVTGGEIKAVTDSSQNGSVILSDSLTGSVVSISPDVNYYVYRMNIGGEINLISSKL